MLYNFFLLNFYLSINNIMLLREIKVTTFKKQAIDDRKFWKEQTPEYRLDILEKLRLEAGNFLYEYPARLQRVISVTRKK